EHGFAIARTNVFDLGVGLFRFGFSCLGGRLGDASGGRCDEGKKQGEPAHSATMARQERAAQEGLSRASTYPSSARTASSSKVRMKARMRDSRSTRMTWEPWVLPSPGLSGS